MTAKEMFEKLGYEIDTTREIENHLFYVGKYAIIDFDLLRGDFYKYNQSGFRSPIDMKLLINAIQNSDINIVDKVELLMNINTFLENYHEAIKQRFGSKFDKPKGLRRKR